MECVFIVLMELLKSLAFWVKGHGVHVYFGIPYNFHPKPLKRKALLNSTLKRYRARLDKAEVIQKRHTIKEGAANYG
jgi:hypothetical protein